MEDYGEAYRRELARVHAENAKPGQRGKPTFDVQRTAERLQRIVEDLQRAGAPLTLLPLNAFSPSHITTSLAIGDVEYAVAMVNDSVKVFWRGRDKIPMVYDVLSPSRMNALARVIIERAVAAAVSEDAKPRTASPRVVRFPQS